MTMTDRPVTIEDVEAALAAAMPEPEPRTPYDDPDASWVYWTPMDTVERGVADEWVWERLRLRRDQALAWCDFTALPDYPGDQAAWQTYRQQLRDLPESTTDPRQAVWPTPPEDTDAR